MTTFEYFKSRYDAKHDYLVECIHKNIPVDSFHFVEVATKVDFGGAETDCFGEICGVDDLPEMETSGYIRRQIFDERSTGRRNIHYISLTKKGLRAFYKTMF